MSMASCILLLLVSLWVLLYSLYVIGIKREAHALRGMRNEIDQPRRLDDDAVKKAFDASIVRTRAACSAKSCENMGDDGLCRLACIYIDMNGHCKMTNTKETAK